MNCLSDKELDRRSIDKGFKDYSDERYFISLHGGQWYVDNPNHSCLEHEFISEYIQNRIAYENKSNMKKSCCFFI